MLFLFLLLLTALLASAPAQETFANVLQIEKRAADAGQVQVLIHLDKPVSYRSEMLHDPERVYVDLDGARPSLRSPAMIGSAGAALISKIVVGEHEPGTTRIVVHLRETCSFNVTPSTDGVGIAIQIRAASSEPVAGTLGPRKIAPVAPQREARASAPPSPDGSATISSRATSARVGDLPASIRPPELPSSDMLIPMLMRADAGNAEAEASIGYLHDIGRFGPTHYEQAAEWYARAASKGQAFAMARLAAMYQNGLGVAEDPARARYWYSRAQERTGIPAGQLKRLFAVAAQNAEANSVTSDKARQSVVPPSIAALAPAKPSESPVVRTPPSIETAEKQQPARITPTEPLPAVEPAVPGPPTRAAMEPHGNVLTIPLKSAASSPAPTAPIPLPPVDPAGVTRSAQNRAALDVPVLPPPTPPPAIVARVPAAPVSPAVPAENKVAIVPASVSAASVATTPRRPPRSIEFDPTLAPKEPKQAFEYFRKGALAGSPEAQFGLGSMYFEGRGVSKNAAEAGRWYEAAAKQGHPRAQSNLGLMYLNGWGVEKSVRQAVAWFRKAAEQGDAAGQSNLGAAYVNGTGVVPDYAAAANWLQKAADQGVVEAQYGLATLYINGRGVQSNLLTAVDYLQRATAQQYPKAQLVLGQLYLSGRVNDANHDAVRLIEAAASSGLPDAQLAMGKMYQEGHGVSKSDVLALKWLQKAAEQKSAEAQYSIAELYRDGRGLPKDPVMAYAWFAVAAANHHEGGLKAINSLSPTMTMAQLSAGQQQAYALMMQILQAGKGSALSASASHR